MTENQLWVENKDNSFFSQKMGKLGKLAGGTGRALAVMGALAGSAAAQGSQSNVILAAVGETTGQVTDCVAFVKEQRDSARETGIAMSRADQKTLLHQCNNGQLEDIIAEQERILAALDAEIQQIGLRINEKGEILDEQGRTLARIVAINGQLIIQRQQLDKDIAAIQADRTRIQEDTERKLQEAERILQSLATS